MPRKHVVLLSHVGYESYFDERGELIFDPERFDITFVGGPEHLRRIPPGQVLRKLAADVRDEESILALIPDLAAGPRIDAVAAHSERMMVPAARIRDTFGVPGFTEAQMTILRDKVLMKEHFAAQGIRVPDHIGIRQPADARGLLAKYGSIVLKPVGASGSEGIEIVHSARDLDELQARGLPVPGRYEAEEFVEGRQFHVDSLVRDGVPVTAVASHYLDRQFAWGGQIRSATVDPGPEREALLAFNRRVLAAMSWFSGVTHLEVFLDRDGDAVLCEIAGRPGGGGIIRSLRHSHGVYLPFASILPQIGLEVPECRPVQPAERGATGWSILFPPSAGRFAAFGAPPDDDWVVDVRILRRVGDVMEKLATTAGGMAVAIVCGPDSATVIDRLNAVGRQVTATMADV
ncbi:acetyl-CoA carboxylase biotin carboxylase subunit family protein [Catenulispora sp. GP43]|uniref:ATP-grasp domain-containing protein n=1 Tax=Catenulispora sp. GP43 TaxID=3156263 RepID=UPI003510DA51